MAMVDKNFPKNEIDRCTDENLMVMFRECSDDKLKNLIFQTIIMRTVDHNGRRKKNWDTKIKGRVGKFIRKSPLLERDTDEDTLYNKILMNLFNAIKNYDPEQEFTHYFNGLITKSLKNELRNFLTKRKQIIIGDQKICHAYQVTDSLDDIIYLSDGEVDRHEVIADNHSFEDDLDRKHMINVILNKCDDYLSDMAFDILLHDNITDQLSNKDLADKYDCCCSRISSIKNKQILPVLDRIRDEVKQEFDFKV